MTARSIWARLAGEVGRSSAPAASVDEPLVVAGFRCARCGGYCPTCSAAPAGWSTVTVRPDRVDTEALAAALFELEPPVDEPGVRRTRPVSREVGQQLAEVDTLVPDQAAPATRRVQRLARPAGGTR